MGQRSFQRSKVRTRDHRSLTGRLFRSKSPTWSPIWASWVGDQIDHKSARVIAQIGLFLPQPGGCRSDQKLAGNVLALLHDAIFSLQIANLVADLGKLSWRWDWPKIAPCNRPNRAVFTPTRRLPIRPKVSRQCLSVGWADFLSHGVRVSPLI